MKLTKLALSFATVVLAAGTMATKPGDMAPDFTGTDYNGKTIKLSDYKGKIVVLESYNSDCPFCNNQYHSGAMQEQQKDLVAKGVIWLLVNSVNPKNDSHRTATQAQQEWMDRKIAATAWLDDSSGDIGHHRSKVLQLHPDRNDARLLNI